MNSGGELLNFRGVKPGFVDEISLKSGSCWPFDDHFGEHNIILLI